MQQVSRYEAQEGSLFRGPALSTRSTNANPDHFGAQEARALQGVAGALQGVSDKAYVAAQKEQDMWVANEVSKAQVYWGERWIGMQEDAKAGAIKNPDGGGPIGLADRFAEEYDKYMVDVLKKAPTGAASDKLTLKLNGMGVSMHNSALQTESSFRLAKMKENAVNATSVIFKSTKQATSPNAFKQTDAQFQEHMSLSKGVLDDLEIEEFEKSYQDLKATRFLEIQPVELSLQQLQDPESELSFSLGFNTPDEKTRKQKFDETTTQLQLQMQGNKYADRFTSGQNFDDAIHEIENGSTFPDFGLVDAVAEIHAETYGKTGPQQLLKMRERQSHALSFREGRVQLEALSYTDLLAEGDRGKPIALSKFDPEVDSRNDSTTYNKLLARRNELIDAWENNPVERILASPDSGLIKTEQSYIAAQQEADAAIQALTSAVPVNQGEDKAVNQALASMGASQQMEPKEVLQKRYTDAIKKLDESANTYRGQLIDAQRKKGVPESSIRAFSEREVLSIVEKLNTVPEQNVDQVMEGISKSVGSNHFYRFIDETQELKKQGLNIPDEYFAAFLVGGPAGTELVKFSKSGPRDGNKERVKEIADFVTGTKEKSRGIKAALKNLNTFNGLVSPEAGDYHTKAVEKYAQMLVNSNPNMDAETALKHATSDVLLKNYYFTNDGMMVPRKKPDGSQRTESSLDFVDRGLKEFKKTLMENPFKYIDQKQFGSFADLLPASQSAAFKEAVANKDSSRMRSIISRYGTFVPTAEGFAFKVRAETDSGAPLGLIDIFDTKGGVLQYNIDSAINEGRKANQINLLDVTVNAGIPL